MSKKSSRTFVSAWNAQPECWCEAAATTRRPSVMGGECTESASARALTTGGDTCEIERRSFGVRAEDVMGNMRPAVFVQYAKLLRRYCNNFRNKKLSAFSSLYSGMSENANRVEWEIAAESICALMYQLYSSQKTKRNATTIMLIDSRLINWITKLFTKNPLN